MFFPGEDYLLCSQEPLAAPVLCTYLETLGFSVSTLTGLLLLFLFSSYLGGPDGEYEIRFWLKGDTVPKQIS